MTECWKEVRERWSIVEAGARLNHLIHVMGSDKECRAGSSHY